DAAGIIEQRLDLRGIVEGNRHREPCSRDGRANATAARLPERRLRLSSLALPQASSRPCSSTIASGRPASGSTGSALPAATSRSRLSKKAARRRRFLSETEGLAGDGPRWARSTQVSPGQRSEPSSDGSSHGCSLPQAKADMAG